jgi:hypothetical protein
VQHRLRAAVLAMILADNLCLRDEPHALFRQIAPLLKASDADETIRQQILTIYHCSFGDPAQALVASKALIRLERNRTLPNLCRALSYASQVSRVCGLMDAALDLATEAFELAQQVHLRSAAAAAACHLIQLNLHLGNTAAARTWLERGRRWSDAPPGSAEYLNLSGQGVNVALAEGRYEDAARQLAEIERCSHHRRTARLVACLTAQRCRLRLLRDGPVLSQSEVTSLLQFHHRTRDLTDQDFLTSVVYRALMGRDAESEARALVREYLTTHRRERSPLEPELAQIVAAMEV